MCISQPELLAIYYFLFNVTSNLPRKGTFRGDKYSHFLQVLGEPVQLANWRSQVRKFVQQTDATSTFYEIGTEFRKHVWLVYYNLLYQFTLFIS